MSLMLLQTIACQEQSKWKTEVLINDISTIGTADSNGRVVKNKTTYVDVSQKFEPTIVVQNKDPKQITYKIRGHVISGGLSINSPQKIIQQQLITKDTLHITHVVNVIGIAGKEDNDFRGYNYEQEEQLHIPNGINVIQIKLYAEFFKQRNKDQEKSIFLAEQIIHN